MPCPLCTADHPPTFEWRGVTRDWHAKLPSITDEYERIYQRDHRQALLAQRRCPCGAPAAPNRTRCRDCLDERCVKRAFDEERREAGRPGALFHGAAAP